MNDKEMMKAADLSIPLKEISTSLQEMIAINGDAFTQLANALKQALLQLRTVVKSMRQMSQSLAIKPPANPASAGPASAGTARAGTGSAGQTVFREMEIKAPGVPLVGPKSLSYSGPEALGIDGPKSLGVDGKCCCAGVGAGMGNPFAGAAAQMGAMGAVGPMGPMGMTGMAGMMGPAGVGPFGGSPFASFGSGFGGGLVGGIGADPLVSTGFGSGLGGGTEAGGFDNGGGIGESNPEDDPRTQGEMKVVDHIRSIWEGLKDSLGLMGEERADGDAKGWSDLITHATQGSKTLSKIYKTKALGETIIDQSRAIANTLATVPFPANIPAAAVMGARVAKQISQIKGQFHDGISNVPSTGTYLLESGERVVDKRLNADLKGFLNEMRGQGSGGYGGMGSMAGPPVTLQINGNPSPSAISDNEEALVKMLRNAYSERGLVSPL